MLARTNDGYRVEHVYRSEAELPSARAPLSRPDVDVKAGDVITAVNGKDVLAARDISDLLLNQADKQVLLQVKRGMARARRAPSSSRPSTWRNRRRCAMATGN